MIAEILAVGTELLLGQIANTDAQYLSMRLPQCGINVYRHTVVGDNPGRLKTAFAEALSRSDIVITTGGLGPTQDDLTKQTIAEHFGLALVPHEPTMELLRTFFEHIGRDMTENNLRQAYFPEGAYILRNDMGTAPGCAIHHEGKVVIILPGPPKELKWMYENVVEAYLANCTGVKLTSRVLRFYGIGESELETRLMELIRTQTNPTIAPYAATGEVTLRLTAVGEESARLLDECEDRICALAGEYMYTDKYLSLAQTLVCAMSERKLTLSVAESCTGGMLCSGIIDISGASGVIKLGLVTYANEAKMDMLEVSAGTLREYGAVSVQCAAQMAEGALKAGKTDMALSTTGIAGPGGGSDDKPVGTVFIALAVRGKETRVIRRLFTRDRDYIRHCACLAAMDMALKELEGNGGK